MSIIKAKKVKSQKLIVNYDKHLKLDFLEKTQRENK